LVVDSVINGDNYFWSLILVNIYYFSISNILVKIRDCVLSWSFRSDQILDFQIDKLSKNLPKHI